MHHLYYIGSRELYTGDCTYPKQWSRTTEAIQLSPQQVRHNCSHVLSINIMSRSQTTQLGTRSRATRRGTYL